MLRERHDEPSRNTPSGLVRRIAWATDVHFNFVDRAFASALCARLRESEAEALLLGGDIAEATDVGEWLRFVGSELGRPVYFVLGNHDYYGGSIASVREQMRALASPWAKWLPALGVVELAPGTALVGHGGWGDARIGDTSLPVLLTDYFAIQELREAARDPLAIDGPALVDTLRKLGDDAADALRPSLIDALERYDRVLVLTHVPPFRESCWHQGAISNEDWLPGFTCKAMGDMLLDVVGSRPDCKVTVLCGHTHGEGEAHPLPNLDVFTQGARYGGPAFRVLELA